MSSEADAAPVFIRRHVLSCRLWPSLDGGVAIGKGTVAEALEAWTEVEQRARGDMTGHARLVALLKCRLNREPPIGLDRNLAPGIEGEDRPSCFELYDCWRRVTVDLYYCIEITMNNSSWDCKPLTFSPFAVEFKRNWDPSTIPRDLYDDETKVVRFSCLTVDCEPETREWFWGEILDKDKEQAQRCLSALAEYVRGVKAPKADRLYLNSLLRIVHLWTEVTMCMFETDGADYAALARDLASRIDNFCRLWVKCFERDGVMSWCDGVVRRTPVGMPERSLVRFWPWELDAETFDTRFVSRAARINLRCFPGDVLVALYPLRVLRDRHAHLLAALPLGGESLFAFARRRPAARSLFGLAGPGAAPAAPAADGRACAGCGATKPLDAFTKAQLKKKGKARCSDCLAGRAVAAPEGAADAADAADARTRTCLACGVTGSGLLRCSKCRRAFYCDRACQVAHHAAHKRVCGVVVDFDKSGTEKKGPDAKRGPEKESKEPEGCPVCLEPRPLETMFTCSHGTCASCGLKLAGCPLCRAPFDLDGWRLDFELPDVDAPAVVEPGAWRDDLMKPTAATWAEVEEVLYYAGRPLLAAERRTWDAAVAGDPACALDAYDSVGWTRLHQLGGSTTRELRTKIDYAREWVAAGCDVNARTRPGPAGHTNYTPSHVAAMHDNAAMLVVFHRLGADFSLTSNEGKTPLATAVACGALRAAMALAKLAPARGVLWRDRRSGKAMNLADVVASSALKQARKPSRYATRDAAVWEELWAFAGLLGGPLDPESAGLYRMGLEGIRSGVGAQGGPGSFTQPFATESDAMEALRAQFASGAMPGMGGEGGAPPGCPVS